MKFARSQLAYLIRDRTARANLRALLTHIASLVAPLRGRRARRRHHPDLGDLSGRRHAADARLAEAAADLR
jgi:hypothetical protein